MAAVFSEQPPITLDESLPNAIAEAFHEIRLIRIHVPRNVALPLPHISLDGDVAPDDTIERRSPAAAWTISSRPTTASGQPAQDIHRGRIVGMFVDLGKILHVTDEVFVIDDEEGPVQNAQFLNRSAIGPAKGAVTVV